MREASKAAARRAHDPLFHSRYFVGNGIDIGAGDDSLARFAGTFPMMRAVRAWDQPDGDAQLMAGVEADAFDFVHSSHCLEHLANPREALANWLRILKPGGFLIVTVPDEDLYEGGHWPSVRNREHLWSFAINRPYARHDRSINVTDLIREFGLLAECESLRLVRHHWRDDRAGHDQTLDAAECAIEFVWRKRTWTAQDLERAGMHHEAIGRDREAEGYYREAIAAAPTSFSAYNQLAHLYTRTGRVDEATLTWHRCVRAIPEERMGHLFRALHLIQRGRMDEGFRLRDPLVPDERRTPVLPPARIERWTGQPLSGRSIVIWTEFGLGDELMFARFAQVFRGMGASRVGIVCQAPLVRVPRTMPGIDEVICREDAGDIGDYDHWVFGHSIPVHHSLEEHGLAQETPYLHANALTEPLPDWDAFLAADECDANHHDATQRDAAEAGTGKRELKVGLVWKGSPTHENDRFRSVHDLEALASLFSVPGVHWVLMQPGASEAELDWFTRTGAHVSNAGPRLGDMADTAALIDRLDLVVSVDTSTVHLAGAMGRPVLLLLPTYTDWRWGITQTHAPWYPSVRLYRQSRLGQWADVVSRVRAALGRRVTQWTNKAPGERPDDKPRENPRELELTD